MSAPYIDTIPTVHNITQTLIGVQKYAGVHMSIKACPFANETCRYYESRPPASLRGKQKHGCFSDLDHIVPQRLGKGNHLAAAFINLAMNKQQLCRDEHDEKSHDGDEPLPSRVDMATALRRADIDGEIRLYGNIGRIVSRVLDQGVTQATEIVACDDSLGIITTSDDSAGHHLIA
jgi:hypothetical protein